MPDFRRRDSFFSPLLLFWVGYRKQKTHHGKLGNLVDELSLWVATAYATPMM